MIELEQCASVCPTLFNTRIFLVKGKVLDLVFEWVNQSICMSNYLIRLLSHNALQCTLFCYFTVLLDNISHQWLEKYLTSC
jgi:hypothetical protein